MDTNLHSWSDEETKAIATSVADLVEVALRIGGAKLDVELHEDCKARPPTVSRTTSRTTIVRIAGEPELVFEITVRRR